MQIVELVLLIIAAYFMGAVSAAYVAVKICYGVDIREYGSGQVGGSNVFRSFSRWLGVLVGLYDAGKGALMVWIAHQLGLGISEQVAIGIAAIVGHNWSVFMRFNGGRGVATSLGVAFALMPWGILVFVAIALLTILIRGSALPVIGGAAAMPLTSWILGEPPSLTLGLLAIFLLLIIRRLTAPIRDKSVSAGERLLARFLFDRDTLRSGEWRTYHTGDNRGKNPDRPKKG